MQPTTTESEALLTGRSSNMTFLAVVLTVGALVLLGLIPPQKADWSAVLIPTAGFGALAGSTAAWARSSIQVFADEVVLTNIARIGRIKRDAVREILAGSGIALVLAHGKVLASSAFPPSLGKTLTHNRRDMRFAERLGTVLQIPVTRNTDVADDSMGTDAVSWSTRWQPFTYAAGGAAVCATVAAITHLALQG